MDNLDKMYQKYSNACINKITSLKREDVQKLQILHMTRIEYENISRYLPLALYSGYSIMAITGSIYKIKVVD